MLPPNVRLPLLVNELALLKKLIFPVLLSPIVNVWLFVVAITPALFRVMFPEIDAVGIPDALLMNANFALLVEVPPSNKSSVILVGDRAPLFLWKYPTTPLVAQVCPLTQMVPVPSGKV